SGFDRVVNFFFAGRRRHTRFSRDWSSDVCSSDLQVKDDGEVARIEAAARIADAALEAVLPQLDTGPTEAAFAAALDGEMRARGEIGRAACRERLTVRQQATSSQRSNKQ